MVIVPKMLNTKPAFFSASQIGEIVGVMLAAHALAFGLAWATHRKTVATSSARRFLVEMYFTLSATSLASSGMFLLSTVPFSVNFYAWVYVLIVAFMVAMFVAAVAWRKARGVAPVAAPVDAGADPEPHARRRRGELADALRLIPTPWTVLTLLIVVLPGVLAVGYKKSADFANMVNSMRMAVRDSGDSQWSLVDAWPGQAFEQPMWVEFDPNNAQRFYLLARPGRLYRYDTNPWKSDVLLDFEKVVGSVDVEMGALAFALHPEFGKDGSPNRGFVYIWHNRWSPQGDVQHPVPLRPFAGHPRGAAGLARRS